MRYVKSDEVSVMNIGWTKWSSGIFLIATYMYFDEFSIHLLMKYLGLQFQLHDNQSGQEVASEVRAAAPGIGLAKQGWSYAAVHPPDSERREQLGRSINEYSTKMMNCDNEILILEDAVIRGNAVSISGPTKTRRRGSGFYIIFRDVIRSRLKTCTF